MNKIIIKNDSCLNINADAVVNAANRNLIAGAGICGAILRRLVTGN